MIKLTAQQIADIKAHALDCYPEEMCGILVEDTFVPLANTHEEPEEHFKVDELTLFPYLGQIQAIIHSHTYIPEKPATLDIRTPSATDVKGQKLSGVPWLIVGTEGQTVTPALELPRTPSNNYIERPFIWFINDCYTLIQDYYQFEFGITLPDHLNTINFKDIRKLDKLFEGHIENYGFRETMDITDMQNGDLLLLDNALAAQSHLGIYHNGEVLHQDVLSVSVPFTSFIGRIHKVLKYVG